MAKKQAECFYPDTIEQFLTRRSTDGNPSLIFAIEFEGDTLENRMRCLDTLDEDGAPVVGPAQAASFASTLVLHVCSALIRSNGLLGRMATAAIAETLVQLASGNAQEQTAKSTPRKKTSAKKTAKKKTTRS